MTVENMTQFPKITTPEQANLDAILNSPTYRIAHEDPELMKSNVMRGVRMLLEITKPDLHLERRPLFLVVPGSSTQTLLISG